jgi:hypothetical protein
VGGILGVESVRKNASSASTSKVTGAATGAAVASGYELTVGTVSGTFCNSMLAPNLSGKDKICLSQVGAFDVVLFVLYVIVYFNFSTSFRSSAP